MRISIVGRNTVVDAFGPLLNGGSLNFRTGTPATNIGDTEAGTLLGTCALGATALAAAANGTGAFSAIGTDIDADADGTAGYVIAKNSSGTQVAFLSVGLTGSGADVEVDKIDFELGGSVAFTGGTMTMPEGTQPASV